ncbi:hypothetical protein GcM1_168001 [Golovinomyces cichoracearum]|uniref:MULE transposase domain-containing protein n=1 Tax=Golovinomyces cichoracearum TaxID=62708 RepID=A0A420J7B9_9PEZI|nr:hypothetical protein GcM1_168001 [Golovinomyces cichoracearum]
MAMVLSLNTSAIAKRKARVESTSAIEAANIAIERILISMNLNGAASKRTGRREHALLIPSGKRGGSVVEGKEFHDREPSDGPVNHSANRTKALNENPEAKRYLVSQLSRNSSVSTIRAELLNTWQIEVIQRDIYNISQSLRNLQLQGKTALQWVIELLEKGPLFFRLDTDEKNRLTYLYLSPEKNIEIWRENPDIFLVDVTYKINRFNQPMINICGSARNSMTPQLAVSFVSGKKEEDYK